MHLKAPVLDNIPEIHHGFFSMSMPTTSGIMSCVISPAPRRWGAGRSPWLAAEMFAKGSPPPPARAPAWRAVCTTLRLDSPALKPRGSRTLSLGYAEAFIVFIRGRGLCGHVGAGSPTILYLMTSK